MGRHELKASLELRTLVVTGGHESSPKAPRFLAEPLAPIKK